MVRGADSYTSSDWGIDSVVSMEREGMKNEGLWCAKKSLSIDSKIYNVNIAGKQSRNGPNI